jgi:hypothetical protein
MCRWNSAPQQTRRQRRRSRLARGITEPRDSRKAAQKKNLRIWINYLYLLSKHADRNIAYITYLISN